MRIFRSYFSKSNTIVKDSLLNSSQNPVTEIMYGGEKKTISRFIFDIDLNPLKEKIESGEINPENIIGHNLCLTNTIHFTPKYIGKQSYNSNIDRASSFILDLFEVNEDWDEGSGYDLIPAPKIDKNQPSNWEYKKTNEEWDNYGAYLSGTTEIIKTIPFDKGNENIKIDITDRIDDLLFDETSDLFGMGLKFTDDLEILKTNKINSVGFHTNNTNTFYQPYIETILNDEIIDDRNFFYQDKDNLLCFSVSENFDVSGLTVNSVDIYDYLGNLYKTFESEEIKYLGSGIYGIDLNISSLIYPDSVIFYDEWKFTINDRTITKKDRFYIISNEDLLFKKGTLPFDNYHFYFWNLNEGEKIKRGEVRKVKLTVKELYANKSGNIPIDIEYRLFTKIENKNEVEIIPFNKVNRIKNSHEFIIDTSWLLPQDYFIEIRMKDGLSTSSKETVSFTIH